MSQEKVDAGCGSTELAEVLPADVSVEARRAKSEASREGWVPTAFSDVRFRKRRPACQPKRLGEGWEAGDHLEH